MSKKTTPTKKKTTNSKRKTAIKKDRTQQESPIPNFHWSAFDSTVRSPMRMQALGRELLRGVKEGRYICLEDFLFEQYIDYQHEWAKWIKQSSELKKAYEIAKQGWYRRRTKLAEEKKCDPRLIADMWHYSKRHQDKVEWQTKLKAQAETDNTNANFGTIVIDCKGEKLEVPTDDK